jgi:hypothetical protein
VNVPVGENGIYFTLKEGDKYELYVPDTMIFTVTQINENLTNDAGDTEDAKVGDTITTTANEVTTTATYTGEDGVNNKAPIGYTTTHQYAKWSSSDSKYELTQCTWTVGKDGNEEGQNQLNHEGVIYDTMDNAVHFKNTKELTANTGVTMDIIPYVLVVAAAAALAVLTIAKKRKTDW